ncbi:MAG: DNA mismatch repair protein MutS [Candidatus Levybacteria bacterium]|nr:DNA mismatch repair protein MutS [Candidatus Levybacteria bacterium]
MQENFSTPMMKQYTAIKKQYADCLLFYRMGDFYELFMEDAHIGARVLNITLTGKANGKGTRIPMAGVPYHAVDIYLAKLVKAGYKVAICEQLSPPNKKGLVDRDVVRIVTPGTMLDEKSLEKKDNNYIISLSIEKNSLALSVADISTGYFATTELGSENREQIIGDEFARIKPKECILPEVLYNDPHILQMLKKEKDLNIFLFHDWDTYATNASRVLKDHFGVSTMAGFGIDDKPHAQRTSAALLGYLQQTQKRPVNHIKKIAIYSSKEYLSLDRSTMINLELFATIRDHDVKGTLLSVLDETVTAMGGRLLKQWMKKPLISALAITERHEAVAELLEKQSKRNELRKTIEKVSDIERLFSRLSVGLGNARDLVNLKSSLESVLEIKREMGEFDSVLIGELEQMIKTTSRSERNVMKSRNLDKQSQVKQIPPRASFGRDDNNTDSIISLIQTYIVAEPPISIREGHMIMDGIDSELDRLRDIVGGSREWIVALEKQEREKTGIGSLKVRFNQVFGFYIEVSKSNLSAVPVTYMRKQTLVNAERFITPELKVQEEIILNAEEKIHAIEYAIFQKVLEQILLQASIIQEAAQSIAAFDCLLNFAYIAEKQHYTRPQLVSDGTLHITAGRHPVVETLLDAGKFVPNDVALDNQNQQLILITGPNMAGKSVYIRQTALIVLMSQMGSFVPAERAIISPTDQIFVRSGASDVITSGLSTFMVEMVETAHILHHATDKSLIIMDEIGRGTSTYDGISIAWAVAEHLVSNLKNPPKTLFATHYHELQVLEDSYPNQIKNFHMAVTNEKDEPVFLHTILPGGASHSFGIAVAKLAGIPHEVVARAKELLEELEKRSATSSSSWLVQDQYSEVSVKKVRDSGRRQNDDFIPRTISIADHIIHKELEQLDISQMTPLEALNTLADLKEKLKLFSLENKKYLEAD